MNTGELNHLLDHLPGFQGTFASNQIPKLKLTTKNKSLICNTDPSHKPGTHWIAMNMYKKGKKNILEVFDSYGTKAKINHSKKWEIKMNKYCFQGSRSIVCGQYCVFFCHKRLLGYSFNQIVQCLKKSKNSDKLVEKYTLWLKKNLNEKMSKPCNEQYCKSKSKLTCPFKVIIK